MFGGMGGGGAGGGMLKMVGLSVTRAGVTNLQETISSSSSSSTTSSPTAASKSTHKKQLNNNNNNANGLSSASGSLFNTPVNNYDNDIATWSSFGGDYWVSVDGSLSDDEKSIGDDCFIGSVPSLDEVHSAVSALTQVFDASSYSQFITDKFAYDDVANQISSPSSILHPVAPVGSEADWMEPSLCLRNSGMMHPYIPDRVYDAFHLLQNDPCIQRMVVSLSSDKAVWKAVLDNDVVRELRETYNSAEENTTTLAPKGSDGTSEDSNLAVDVVKWIFQSTKAKVMRLREKIMMLMHKLFKTPENNTTEFIDPFEEKIRTSWMLSVVVMLIVVVTRAGKA